MLNNLERGKGKGKGEINGHLPLVQTKGETKTLSIEISHILMKYFSEIKISVKKNPVVNRISIFLIKTGSLILIFAFCLRFPDGSSQHCRILFKILIFCLQWLFCKQKWICIHLDIFKNSA